MRLAAKLLVLYMVGALAASAQVRGGGGFRGGMPGGFRGGSGGPGIGVGGHPGFRFGGHPGFRFGGHHGFHGRVGFGFGPRLPVNPFATPFSTFPQRLGATVSGFPAFTGAPIGHFGFGHARRHFFGQPFPFVAPVGFPAFFGGFSVPAPAPNIIIIVPAPYQREVVVHQQTGAATTGWRNYDRSGPSSITERPGGWRDYDTSNTDRPVYRIVLKNNTIESAWIYWIEGETLHCVTPKGDHKTATLDSVHRRYTELINRAEGRHVTLPPERE